MFQEYDDFETASYSRKEMTVLQESTFKILRIEQGLRTYVPVTFGKEHFCIADLTLHSVLLNYRLDLTDLSSLLVNVRELWTAELFPGLDKDSLIEERRAEDKGRLLADNLKTNAKELRSYITQITSLLPENWSGPPLPPHVELFPSGGDESTPLNTTAKFIREMSEATAYLYRLNLCLQECLKAGSRTIRGYLRQRYCQDLKAQYELNISKQVSALPPHTLNTQASCLAANKAVSKKIRKNSTAMLVQPLQVEDTRYSSGADLPIIFEEVAYSDCPVEVLEGIHVVMLVHGYQGCSFDMDLVRNYLQLVFPRTIVHASMINEHDSNSSIAEQGERLAHEVVNLLEGAGLVPLLAKLSFVGHSMGGLVVRAALPHLERFAGVMHSYISLSTPHLGIAGKTSKLVGIGIWFLKKWNKSTSLRQISMTDSPHRSKSYLFELSSCPGLNWFRYVVLMSSHQDTYAPFESARIEVCPKTAKDSGGVFSEMAANILTQLQQPSLIRLDVNFSIRRRSFDAMIGRTAHIEFLDSESLARILVFCYPQFFC
jgi:pimeloyl-ACP methyl ester carboxylesterase